MNTNEKARPGGSHRGRVIGRLLLGLGLVAGAGSLLPGYTADQRHRGNTLPGSYRYNDAEALPSDPILRAAKIREQRERMKAMGMEVSELPPLAAEDPEPSEPPR